MVDRQCLQLLYPEYPAPPSGIASAAYAVRTACRAAGPRTGRRTQQPASSRSDLQAPEVIERAPVPPQHHAWSTTLGRAIANPDVWPGRLGTDVPPPASWRSRWPADATS